MKRLYTRLEGFRSHHPRGFVSDAKSTVDNAEIDRFNKLSNTWWAEKGSLASLHSMNKLRVPLIAESFDDINVQSYFPLKGKIILDVGCGGGILSESLARLGATVTGLDAAADGIEVASQRQQNLNETTITRNLSYVRGNIEHFVKTHERAFDLVVASEVIEHVTSIESFVEGCVRATKPGGSVLVTTINQTCLSYMLAIVAAERIFQLLPNGTHEWEKFVTPQKLQETFERFGCRQTLLHGMTMNALTKEWSWTPNTDINYSCRYFKG
ncbi:ubiquinone biosynthesis O-methyltransferase, mitochondrial-like [Watersipora subatra]|uniref:ubiquinone biosynthesis O-methyltransferase, mitochondrial-like n=1 Tax=Watersipora subatra TaxID=2589382 RepID=UPI00355C54CF